MSESAQKIRPGGRRLRGEECYEAIKKQVVLLARNQSTNKYWRQQGICPYDQRRYKFNFTTRSLAAVFGIGRGTADRAIKRMIEDGTLVWQNGKTGCKRPKGQVKYEMRDLVVAPALKQAQNKCKKNFAKWVAKLDAQNETPKKQISNLGRLKRFSKKTHNRPHFFNGRYRFFESGSPVLITKKVFLRNNGEDRKFIEAREIDMRLNKKTQMFVTKKTIGEAEVSKEINNLLETMGEEFKNDFENNKRMLELEKKKREERHKKSIEFSKIVNARTAELARQKGSQKTAKKVRGIGEMLDSLGQQFNLKNFE